MTRGGNKDTEMVAAAAAVVFLFTNFYLCLIGFIAPPEHFICA